jgi:hypothetical protein
VKRLLLLCSVLIAAWSIEPAVQHAHAQEPGASSERKSRAKRAKRAKKSKRGATAAAPEPAAAAPAPSGSKTEAPVPATEGATPPAPDGTASASSAISGDEGQVRKEGDTEVKTLEFTGLDIEGQLKTPQLLYFLTRLRAEFDRPRLPHRSFMPELRRTPGEKALR